MTKRRPADRTRSPRIGARQAGLRTALVLQGGAALGAYEAGVLTALLEPPARHFEVVSGCSVGAVMAAIIVGARDDPIATLHDMWERFVMPDSPFLPLQLARGLLLGDRSIYRVNPSYLAAPFFATHLYDTAPLAAALDKWIDFRKLNRAETEVIVTAVDVKSGRLTEFSNRKRLAPRHILASASLPPIFPGASFGGHQYWDGGLISNTPLRPAINAIETLNQAHGGGRWELMVVDLFAPKTQAPANLGEVIERVFELLFFGKFAHDMKLFEAMNAQLDLMQQVDKALPARSPVRKHRAYLKLKRHRRVDRLTVIRTRRPNALGGPADFSAEAIERRLRLGYADARRVLKR